MTYTAVDNWNLTPDTFPIIVSVLRRGVQTPIEGGMIQRRQTLSSESVHGQAAKRTFTLNFGNATKSEYNRAVALWKNTTGGTQGLDYSISDLCYGGSENLIVRMKAAPLLLRKLSHGRYAFTVILEEMFHVPT